jgi:chemotaxis protein MotB
MAGIENANGSRAVAVAFIALILVGCVPEEQYQQQGELLKQTQLRAAAQQQQIAKMEEQDRWVVAGDLLFPPGGYQLTANGRRTLSQYLPRLLALQNSKVIVYGFTDRQPVGAALQRRGIADNLDLSSRRADEVVAYFVSQGVNPNIISAKGFGDTHPIAPNASAEGRAQNRRIEIVVEGPSA